MASFYFVKGRVRLKNRILTATDEVNIQQNRDTLVEG
jgi:hypothetical protein